MVVRFCAQVELRSVRRIPEQRGAGGTPIAGEGCQLPGLRPRRTGDKRFSETHVFPRSPESPLLAQTPTPRKGAGPRGLRLPGHPDGEHPPGRTFVVLHPLALGLLSRGSSITCAPRKLARILILSPRTQRDGKAKNLGSGQRLRCGPVRGSGRVWAQAQGRFKCKPQTFAGRRVECVGCAQGISIGGGGPGLGPRWRLGTSYASVRRGPLGAPHGSAWIPGARRFRAPLPAAL